MPQYIRGHRPYNSTGKRWLRNCFWACACHLCILILCLPELEEVFTHAKYLLEQWLVGVLALVGFQLLMFLKGLLTTFKTALFSRGLLVLEKIKEQFIAESFKDKNTAEVMFFLLSPIYYKIQEASKSSTFETANNVSFGKGPSSQGYGFFQWSCMDVRVGLRRKLSAEELMLLNCGIGEDSWESLGLQGGPTSPS